MDKKLIITLKSDLCAATGDGFSSSIDIDVCLDDKGIPFIPGRRLKGCLREAAQEVGCGSLDEIFGAPGQGKAGCIRVGTAYISDIQTIEKAIDAGGYSPAAVAQAFTYVRAQTAIEEDSVKDGSLRFLRVVKRYFPMSADEPKELSFEAAISFEEKYAEDVVRAAKALRNIGHRRNRGMGAVRCVIVDDEPAAPADLSIKRFDGGIAYAVKLEEPLMIPKQGNESMAYIPGTSVMGFFAGKLAKKLNPRLFEDMFLSDKMTFSPLYPTDENGMRTIPAFGLIAKIKGTQQGTDDGKVVNLARYLQDNGGSPKAGEQPKPLKKGFVGASTFYPLDPETEIIYHHATGKATNTEPTLYTQECLSAGQVFAGFITGEPNHLSLIEQILKEEKLTFGRSKTAQYSLCSLTPFAGSAPRKEPLSTNPGEKIIALLDSDVLLDSGYGSYTNNADDLIDKVCDSCNGTRYNDDLAGFKYRIVGGYNAKWNQKKPTVRAFAAGSFFVMTATDNTVPSEILIGERTTEGFGRVILIKAADVVPIKPEVAEFDAAGKTDGDNEWKTLFEKEEATEELRQATLNYAVNGCSFEKFSSSSIGRILLMATQADSKSDFDKRIESIKTDDVKQKAQKIIEDLRKEIKNAEWDDEQECLKLLLNFAKYGKKQESSKGGA